MRIILTSADCLLSWEFLHLVIPRLNKTTFRYVEILQWDKQNLKKDKFFLKVSLLLLLLILLRPLSLSIVTLEMVESVVKTALRYPEIPLQDDSEEKEKDRIACSANLVHQVNFHNHPLIPPPSSFV